MNLQPMSLRRAGFIAAFIFSAAGPAAAQFQPLPQQQQEPPCIKEFTTLRDEAEKKAGAIRAASERKAPPKEACALFNSFSAAEVKLIKYAQDNMVWCGIPKEAIDGMKKGHANTVGIRAKVCQAAAAPPRPAGPSLSDALNAPIFCCNSFAECLHKFVKRDFSCSGQRGSDNEPGNFFIKNKAFLPCLFFFFFSK